MNIKYLKIRNIASIEEADIDFENGLTDKINDAPASLFLITGDTGSGKSVILDCISMALFGTTPRLKGVENRTNNKFLIGDGKEMSVSDISQYTRIGITNKQECYSELKFIGNDGHEYISRFTLGMTSHGNHNKPKWQIIVDGRQPQESTRLKDIEAILRPAIGMSYEQFCRMAMLAQGQFASFLTGKKEERVEILEQLTNTEIFNRYGEAIKEIHSQKKSDYDTQNRIYQNELAALLTEEKKESLNNTLDILNAKLETSKKEIGNLSSRRYIVKSLLDAVAKEEGLLQEKSDMETRLKEERYLDADRKIAQWDNTNSLRAIYSARQSTQETLNGLIDTIFFNNRVLITLEENLKARDADLEKLHKEKTEMQNLKQPFADKEDLLHKAGEVVLKIKTLLNFQQQVEEKENKIKNLSETAPILEQKIAALETRSDVEEKRLYKMREALDASQKNRDALNLEKINHDLQDIASRKEKIKSLVEKIQEYSATEKSLDELQSSISALKAELGKMEAKKTKADTNLKTAETARQCAESRYTSMHLSVQDNFTDLRKKLAKDEIDVCPLCGNSHSFVSEEETESFFSKLLTPLEEEKDKAAKEYEDTLEICQKITDTINEIKNKLTGEKRAWQVIESQASTHKSTISDTLNQLHQPLVAENEWLTLAEEGLPIQLEELTKNEEDLNGEVAKATGLDGKIKRMRNIASLIETALNDSANNLSLTQKDLSQNQNSQRSLKEEIQSIQKQIEEESVALSSEIGNCYPDWKNDLKAATKQIDADAKALKEIESALSEIDKNIGSAEKLTSILHESLTRINQSIASLRGMHAQLAGVWPENAVEEAEEIPEVPSDEESLKAAWANLRDAFSASGAQVKAAVDEISKSTEALEKQLSEKNLSEETLKALIDSEDDIRTLREYKSETDRNLLINEQNLAEIKKLIEDACDSLELKHSDKLPDADALKDLESRLTELENAKETQLQEISKINTLLESDAESLERLKGKLSELNALKDVYDRWGRINKLFGGNKFRTLVQSYILRPLLRNANIYLHRITDRFTLTCSDTNEQLSILVEDAYNKGQTRSATLLSGGEKFMISLALSLSLSAMNKSDLNVDILFIDEGFGTLDATSLNSVMETLRRLPEIVGQNGRRVGVISHREELQDEIPSQIRVLRQGEGRSRVEVVN